MADSTSVTCQTVPEAASDRLTQDPTEARQLAALRSVLLGPLYKELEALRARVVELENPDHQVTRIAGHLPQAFALRPPTDPEIARALSPLIELTLWESLRKNPPPGGAAARVVQSLRHCASAPVDMARNLPFCGGPTANGQIMCLRLVHRKSYTLIEEFTRPMDDPQELDAIVSMQSLLHEKLRDETFQAGYEKLESLRIGDLAYGIHVGPLAILFSVIRGKHPAAALARCKASLETIHHIHAVALGDFDPANGLCELLPKDLRGEIEP